MHKLIGLKAQSQQSPYRFLTVIFFKGHSYLAFQHSKTKPNIRPLSLVCEWHSYEGTMASSLLGLSTRYRLSHWSI